MNDRRVLVSGLRVPLYMKLPLKFLQRFYTRKDNTLHSFLWEYLTEPEFQTLNSGLISN